MERSRKLEIAYSLIKLELQQKEIKFDKNKAQREFGNISKKTGIPAEELNIFYRDLLLEMVEETFLNKGKVN